MLGAKQPAPLMVTEMLLSMALTLAVALPPPSAAMPGYMDQRLLAPLCSSLSLDADAPSLCLGYIAGSVDQLLAQQAIQPVNRRSICLPSGLPIKALRDAVLRRLVQRPVAQEAAAASLIRDALEAAFPCPPPTLAVP